MDCDINKFTESDVERMGVDIFLRLLRTQNKIIKQKHYVAYVCPEAQKADDCKHHERCVVEWKGTWQNGFCKFLLHPERPISPKSALLRLEEANFEYMSKNCHSNTMHYIKETKTLDFEDRIVDNTIKELLEEQNLRRMHRVVGPRPPSRDRDEEAMDVQLGDRNN